MLNQKILLAAAASNRPTIESGIPCCAPTCRRKQEARIWHMETQGVALAAAEIGNLASYSSTFGTAYPCMTCEPVV